METKLLNCSYITDNIGFSCSTAGVVCQGMCVCVVHACVCACMPACGASSHVYTCTGMCAYVRVYMCMHMRMCLFLNFTNNCLLASIWYMYFSVCANHVTFVFFSTGPATNYSNCSNGDVRLVGSVDGDQGRLEVCVNSAWGTVCSNAFGASDAAVACEAIEGYNSTGKRHRHSFITKVGKCLKDNKKFCIFFSL